MFVALPVFNPYWRMRTGISVASCGMIQLNPIATYCKDLSVAAEFLTTKQVQDLLKVDRTTVYRMLKDGRLKGVRIGQQWRFPLEELNSLLSKEGSNGSAPVPVVTEILPVHCVQVIQDVFSDIAQVGAVTISPDGQQLTTISNCSDFCGLLLATESGRESCMASWTKTTARGNGHSTPSCHAGLQCAGGRIEVGGRDVAVLIAGQYYTESPILAEQHSRVIELAAKHGIDAGKLLEAAAEINVLDEHKRNQMSVWLKKIADTFEQISSERANLMGRLRDIANLTGIPGAAVHEGDS